MLISLVILSVLAVGLLSALAAASKVLLQTNVRETAKNLAETQMEYIKSEPYVPAATTYPALPISAPQQGRYTITVQATPVPGRTDVQLVTANVTGPGNPPFIYSLQDYKIQK